MRYLVSTLFLVGLLWGGGVHAGVLDNIGQTGVIKIGYRDDAPPYAYKNAIGEAAGYTVDLCRAVTAGLKVELKLKDISVEYIPVSAEERFEAVKSGKIDMLCGATTATLSRRKIVDFSIPTFIDGASVLFRTDGPSDFEGLGGHKVGVRAGTTTEEALRNTLKELQVAAEVVAVADHNEGMTKLKSGELSAYFADQAILVFLMVGAGGPSQLRLSRRLFTHEPYALGLPRGDSDFRLAVDRALSRIYRSHLIEGIFRKNFGSLQPTDVHKALYLINSLPE